MTRRGRPPKEKGSTKTAPLGIRVQPELKLRLENAANESKRSLSQEIDLRLRASFEDHDQPIIERFGGKDSYALLRFFAEQIKAIEQQAGHRWYDDAFTFEECQEMLNENMHRLRPKGRRIIPHGPAGSDMDGGLGKRTARIAMSQIKAIREGFPWFGDVGFSLSVLAPRITKPPTSDTAAPPKSKATRRNER